MKEKCCKNCFLLQRRSHPEDQFCGEKWISIKIKTRIDNLEKLGI